MFNAIAQMVCTAPSSPCAMLRAPSPQRLVTCAPTALGRIPITVLNEAVRVVDWFALQARARLDEEFADAIEAAQ